MASVVTEKRARAFAHLDEARLGWFHLRAVLVSGVGFFADAYDIFVISQCLPMIYQVYYPSYVTGTYPAQYLNPSAAYNATASYTPQQALSSWASTGSNVHLDALLKASTSWGNLIGQLGFGYLGDKLGRKKMYGVELIIMVIATIGSAFSAPAVRGFDIVTILFIWRFFLGVGIGGDYPMSAVITSEFANVRYRGMLISAVFAMQGIGILVGGVVFVCTLTYMKSYIVQDYNNVDYVWRIALGVGIIPAIFAIYFRLTIPETPRFTVDVVGDTDKAEKDVEKVLQMNAVVDVTSNWGQEGVATKKVEVKQNDFFRYFSQWKHLKILLGCAYSWLALDIAWYGMSLNSSTMLGLINYNGPAKISGYTSTDPVTGATKTWSAFTDPSASCWDYFYQRAIGNIIIAVAGTVPGYWFTVALIEVLGRKPIQIGGFLIVAVMLAVMAGDWGYISVNTGAFVAVYTIAQFFYNFGPNATTFVYPGEVFPTRYRSTGHGISAAIGKVGAILGVQAVGPYFTSHTTTVLWVFCAIMVTGIFSTIILPETKGKTLEELSLEDNVIVEETAVEYVPEVKQESA
ncbi:Inorganic phosphate transporter pho84 [Cladochytrium tenue]|nr:Inorganic phosphate transporter pho84 [Cladochytrium tenue]